MKEKPRNLSQVYNNFSTVSLESDFSSNNNYVNFYMNDEMTDFGDIQESAAILPQIENHIVVSSSYFNSSVYNFILPLRARYLQEIRDIGRILIV